MKSVVGNIFISCVTYLTISCRHVRTGIPTYVFVFLINNIQGVSFIKIYNFIIKLFIYSYKKCY